MSTTTAIYIYFFSPKVFIDTYTGPYRAIGQSDARFHRGGFPATTIINVLSGAQAISGVGGDGGGISQIVI